MAVTAINKIIISGNEAEARKYIGPAQSQMDILINQMSFQNLKQGIREVQPYPGVIIRCKKIFNYQECRIFVSGETIETIYAILSIVYGNKEEYIQYGDTAVDFIDGEAVLCSDDGYGLITTATESKLYGSFALCAEGMIQGESSGAVAAIAGCIEKYYDRLYQFLDVYGDGTIVESVADLSSSSSFDIPPLSYTQCSALNCSDVVTVNWSKTYDKMVVTAFVHLPMGCDGYTRWSVSASFEDSVVQWEFNGNYFPSSGYARYVCTSATCVSYTDTFMGVEVWSEVNGEGETEYYIATMSDQEEVFTLWKYDPTDIEMKAVYSYASNVRTDYFSIGYHPERHVRLIGLNRESQGVYKAYWCDLGHSGDYYEENLITGGVTVHTEVADGSIETALWHPIENELFFVTDDDSEAGSPVIEVKTEKDTTEYSAGGVVVSVGCFFLRGTGYKAAKWCDNTFPIAFHGGVAQIYDGSRDSSSYGDWWTGGGTIAWVDTSTTTSYNNFSVAGNTYSKGSQVNSSTASRTLIKTLKYKGDCGNAIQSSVAQGDITRQIPSGRSDYEFLGGVFGAVDGIGYKYRYATYTEEEDPSDPTATISVKGDWVEHTSAGVEEPAISELFPYDHNWKAILLHGITAESEDSLDESEVRNMIIYNDPDNLESFLVVDGAISRTFTEDRAFFKQQIATTTETI